MNKFHIYILNQMRNKSHTEAIFKENNITKKEIDEIREEFEEKGILNSPFNPSIYRENLGIPDIDNESKHGNIVRRTISYSFPFINDFKFVFCEYSDLDLGWMIGFQRKNNVIQNGNIKPWEICFSELINSFDISNSEGWSYFLNITCINKIDHKKYRLEFDFDLLQNIESID